MDHTGKTFVIIVLIVGAFTYFVNYNYKPRPDPQWKKTQRVAEMCWKDYERRSLSAATKQFIAGACETFDAQWKRERP